MISLFMGIAIRTTCRTRFLLVFANVGRAGRYIAAGLFEIIGLGFLCDEECGPLLDSVLNWLAGSRFSQPLLQHGQVSNITGAR